MTTLICSKTNQTISLTVSIAQHGEGEVWRTDCSGYLAKIYHDSNNERIAKLELMIKRVPQDPNAHQNHISFAWPYSILKDSNGKVVGFLMPEVENSLDLLKLCTPRMRKSLGIDANWYFLHVVARNIAGIIQAIHNEGYVVGDIRLQNILVNNRALPTIIDTDSFQVVDPVQNKVHRCLVGAEGFTPPELIGKDIGSITQSAIHDRFRLGVVIYYLLFGGPPFRGNWIGSGDPPEQVELVRRGFWPYAPNSLIQPSNNTIPLEIIHPRLQQCFLQCFNDGHSNPSKRPSAKVWLEALEVAFNELQSCGKIDSHFYDLNYGHCYWCDRAQNLGIDIFPGNSISYSSIPISISPISNNQSVSSKQINSINNSKYNNFPKNQKKIFQFYLILSKNKLFYQLKSLIYWKKVLLFLLPFGIIMIAYIYWYFNANADYYLSRAITYSYEGKYDKAILDYEKAIEINSNNADYYEGRGKNYYNLEKYNEAILDYEKAIEINPNNVDYYEKRAEIYYFLEKYNKAILDYSKAIEIDPNNQYYYNQRGNSYSSLKQYNKAILDYSKAIKIDSKSAHYYNRGNSYSSLKQYNKAILDYSKAIEIDPNHENYYYQRGINYFSLKKYDESILDYDKAIKINPNNVNYYYQRGNIYYYLKKYDEAISNYILVVKIDPSNADYYYQLGKSYHDKGDNDGVDKSLYSYAISNYNKAIEIDPNNADYYYQRGKNYHVLLDYKKAILDYDKAIKINPNNADYYYDRKISYDYLGYVDTTDNISSSDDNATTVRRRRRQRRVN